MMEQFHEYVSRLNIYIDMYMYVFVAAMIYEQGMPQPRCAFKIAPYTRNKQ